MEGGRRDLAVYQRVYLHNDFPRSEINITANAPMNFEMFHYDFDKILEGTEHPIAAGTWYRYRWKKDRLQIKFLNATPSSVWLLHLSNTRIDAAPPVLSRIFTKYSSVKVFISV